MDERVPRRAGCPAARPGQLARPRSTGPLSRNSSRPEPSSSSRPPISSILAGSTRRPWLVASSSWAAELDPLAGPTCCTGFDLTRASDPAASLGFASELIGLGHSLGDDRVLARGLVRAAIIQSFAKPDEGQKIAEEAARLAQVTGQHNMLVKSLQFEAWAYCYLGRPNAAFPLAEKAVEIAQEFDLRWDEGWARQALSQAARLVGQFERSLQEAEDRPRAQRGAPRAVCLTLASIIRDAPTCTLATREHRKRSLGHVAS